MQTSRRRTARVMGLCLALASLVGLAGGCAPALQAGPGEGATPTPALATAAATPPGEISPEELPTRAAAECPGLDSQLYQVTQADDPLARARELQLRVEEEKVQVLLVLAGEDVGFLEAFEAEVGTQVDTQVQAFVPIGRLCELAQADEVLAVRVPARAAPQ